MARKSLTKAIEELVNSLDKNPLAEARTLKNPVMALLPLAKVLEDGEAIREAEAKVTSLEEQVSNLELQVQTANSEINRFRAEEKERKKKDADLPDQQWELLRILEPENLGLIHLPDILQSVSFPADEVAWHLGQLKGLQLADFTHNASDQQMWFRTHEGNRRAIARRRANISERLPEIFEKVLVTIHEAGSNGINTAGIVFMHDISEDLALSYGQRLRELGFVTQHYTGIGIVFKQHPDGVEYIKTHRLIEKKYDERKRIEEERRLPDPDELPES